MEVQQAIDKLKSLLPLADRQQQLHPELRHLHQLILYTFVEQGRPLPISDAADHLARHSVQQAFHLLAKQDLIVLDVEQQMIMGAYPMTYEVTPHIVEVNGHAINAMCALDALAVAPMFGIATRIKSSCVISGEPVLLQMFGQQVESLEAPADLCVGIRWQTPCGAAAHSLCRDMVFLGGQGAVDKWQQRSDVEGSAFDIPAAVAIGAAFFRPLLASLEKNAQAQLQGPVAQAGTVD